jgi:hypothetical protein
MFWYTECHWVNGVISPFAARQIFHRLDLDRRDFRQPVPLRCHYMVDLLMEMTDLKFRLTLSSAAGQVSTRPVVAPLASLSPRPCGRAI